jgi:hypothetical protein
MLMVGGLRLLIVCGPVPLAGELTVVMVLAVRIRAVFECSCLPLPLVLPSHLCSNLALLVRLVIPWPC